MWTTGLSSIEYILLDFDYPRYRLSKVLVIHDLDDPQCRNWPTKSIFYFLFHGVFQLDFSGRLIFRAVNHFNFDGNETILFHRVFTENSINLMVANKVTKSSANNIHQFHQVHVVKSVLKLTMEYSVSKLRNLLDALLKFKFVRVQ